MIAPHISRKILTIGCAYKPPRGGIAQVLEVYDREVFGAGNFKFVANSGNGNVASNALVAAWALLLTLVRLCCDWSIRVVHIHTSSYISFWRAAVSALVARAFGKRVVMHVHSGAFKTFCGSHTRAVCWVLRRCHAVVGLTPSWGSFFEQLQLRRVAVIPNVVPSAQLAPRRPAGELHLLYLGLLSRDKGAYDLLQAMALLPASCPVRLHVGGNGDTAAFTREIARLGLDQKVEFLGWVSGERKVGLLNSCHAMVLPSYYEGLPMSVLEALAYGMAVIATPVGGVPEVVDNNSSGILVEPGDVQALAAAIERLAADAQLRDQMGRESARRGKDFLPQAAEARLTQLYTTLLGMNGTVKK